tara:strand:+ start:229 stop:393 length:165 start_codon:yes stop_codon:yes gene_type:complete
MKKEEEIILEEQTIRNTQLEDVFQKTLEFNNNYLKYLKQKLEEAKKIREEILNG